MLINISQYKWCRETLIDFGLLLSPPGLFRAAAALRPLIGWALPGVGFHFRVWGHSVPLCALLKEQAPGFRLGGGGGPGTMGFFYGGVGSPPKKSGWIILCVWFLLSSPALYNWRLELVKKKRLFKGRRGRKQPPPPPPLSSWLGRCIHWPTSNIPGVQAQL